MTVNKANEEIVKGENEVININNLQSPYYLCSSDHPGNVISPVILDSDNYANRSRVLTNALKSKHKFGFVNGDIAKPNDASPDGHAWEKCNSMVIAWFYTM